MVTIRPLTIGCLCEALMPVPIHEAVAYIDRFGHPGMNYAAFRDGHLLGCGGITARPDEREPGVGEAWVLLTAAGRRYTHASYRAMRRLLQAAMVEMQLQHVQVLVRQDFPAAHRLAEHLGFTLQWHGYQAGADGVLYDFYYGVPRKGEANGRE